MSRYIDADDALEVLNLMYDNQEDKDDPYNVGVMGATNYIKHRAPSLEIVRCGECKYTDFCEKKIHRHGIAYSIDFCSYGSSSEKPNNCDTCRFELYCPEMCEGCCEWDSHYEPNDEPQTERSE